MAGKDPKLTTVLELDGEKQYRQAMSEIASQLKVQASNMALLTEQYGENSDSVEANAAKAESMGEKLAILQQKQSMLTQMLEKARQAQEAARRAVEEANQNYQEQAAKLDQLRQSGDATAEAIERQESALKGAKNALDAQEATLNKANKAVNAYQTNLNYTNRDIHKTTDEIDNCTTALDKNTDAQEEAARAGDSLGGTLADLISAMGVRFPAGANEMLQSVNGSTLALTGMIAASSAMIKNLVDASKDTALLADDILTLSTVSGISTDTIQAWNFAAEEMDVSAQTVMGSMRQLTNNMYAAKRGAAEQAEAFKALHVRVTGAGGKMREVEDVFWDAIQALGKMTNETEKDALAMKIFGESAQTLNPLIQAGRQGFEEFTIKAQEMGYIMDTQTLNSFVGLSDAMAEFENSQQAVKQTLGQALLPLLTSLFELLSSIDPKVIATVSVIAMVVTVIVTLLKAIKPVTDSIGIVKDLLGGLNPAMLKTTAIIIGVVAVLVALAIAIAAIIGKADDFKESMKTVGETTSQLQGTVSKAQGSIKGYATGTSFHPGGLAVVGEKGPELVRLPRGSQVFTNSVSNNMLKNAGSTTIYESNTFAVQDVADYERIMAMHKNQRLSRRKGYVR